MSKCLQNFFSNIHVVLTVLVVITKIKIRKNPLFYYSYIDGGSSIQIVKDSIRSQDIFYSKIQEIRRIN